MRVRAIATRSESFILRTRVRGTVEYAIEMRRFDEERTIAAVVGHDELAGEQIRDVATPPFMPRHEAGARRIRPATFGGPATQLPRAVERFTGSFLVNRRALIDARAQAGYVRDGHGDLRAEHVVLEEVRCDRRPAGVRPRTRRGLQRPGRADEHAIRTVRSSVYPDLLVDAVADWLDARAAVA